MSLTTNAIKKLEQWIGPSTSLSGSPQDDERFYGFVAEAWQGNLKIWDESSTREIMSAKFEELHPDWPAEEIQKTVDSRVSEGTLILDFLSYELENLAESVVRN